MDLALAERRIKSGFLCFALGLHVLVGAAPVSPGHSLPLAYPPAARDQVIDDFHGVKVPDPYRWLEQLDSAETRRWVMAEARLTDSYLQKIPARPALKQ